MALRSPCLTRMIVGGALVIALPATSQAQIDESAMESAFEKMAESMMKSVQKSMEKTNNTRILISPSLVKVDVTQKTATIEFENKTKDTLDADISVRLQPPASDMFGSIASVKTKAGNGSSSPLLDDEATDTKTDTKSEDVAVDSISADRSLAGWIKGLPASITLKPGEKKTVTITLDVPANLQPGDYAAWIITSTSAKLNLLGDPDDIEVPEGLEGVKVEAKIDENEAPQTLKIEGGAKVLYRVETK